MEQVKARLNAIMRRHLIPAGHEFSKVIYDFNRLRQGRELFDRNALEEISTAKDNNQRDRLIERFADHVLPNYDDVRAVWPDIRATLLATIDAVRATEPVEIETPFGAIPGTAADRVEGRIAAIVKGLRYIDIEQTFDDAANLYESASSDAVREHWLQILKSLSANNIAVWREHGPAVQLRLVQHLATLTAERRGQLRAAGGAAGPLHPFGVPLPRWGRRTWVRRLDRISSTAGGGGPRSGGGGSPATPPSPATPAAPGRRRRGLCGSWRRAGRSRRG